MTALVWISLLIGLACHAHFHPRAHTVYTIYAPAARAWWAGEDIYIRRVDYFRYSPLVAIAFTPFALLPDEWGCPLWKVFNGVMFAAAVAAWAQSVLPVQLSRTQRALLLLLVLPTSVHSMYNGQANLVMLAAVLFGLAAAAKERWNAAALCLALATLIKGYPLALGLLLIALYPRRFAIRFLVAIALGLLLPFAAQRPSLVSSQYTSWLNHLADSTSIMRERLRSIDHLVGLYYHPVAPAAFALWGLVAGIGVAALCLWTAQCTADSRDRLTRVFLLFASWVVLFGPATESCTYAVIAPAIAWSLVEAFASQAGWTRRALLVASLLLMGPLVTDLFGATIRNFANERGSQPLGALLYLVYLLCQLATGHRQAELAEASAPPHCQAAA
jgi:hypothetical protein